MMRFFNDQLLKSVSSSNSSSPVYASLEDFFGKTLGSREELEAHGRNVGKAHGLKNLIVSLSKVLVSLLLQKDSSIAVAAVESEMMDAWDELLQLPLPEDLRANMLADAGQELAEAIFVETYVDYVIFGGTPGPIGEPIQGMESRLWLAGLLDAVSEISKLVNDELMLKDHSAEEELALRSRFVDFGKSACAFLSTFKGVPPAATNASRRPGQGFQSKLVRVENLVQLHQRDLLQLRREVRK